MKAIPSKLENAILRGALTAARKYEFMADYWLDRAPESFINIHVGLAMAGAGYYADVDASVRKVHRDIDNGTRRRGRRVAFERQRPDVSVWYKSDNTLLSIIETKKAYSSGGLKSDVVKLKKHLNHSRSAKLGYLLVYTESYVSKGNARDSIAQLQEKIRRWEKKLGLSLVGMRLCAPAACYYGKSSGRWWSWGFALFRV